MGHNRPVRAHKLVFKSEIRSKSLRAEYSRSVSQKQTRNASQKFHFWGQDLFQCILKVYFSDFDLDLPIPLLTDINSFKVH